jgi:invasion protein IalB
MRIATKSSILAFVIFILVGLNCFALSANAQTLQPKQAQPTPDASDTQPQPSPQTTAPQPTWMVNCTNVAGGFDCRASQTLVNKNTGKAVVTLVVRTTPGTKKPVMLVQVPLGIYLPAGIGLQIGRDAMKTLQLQSCNLEGCLTEYSLADAEIAAMQRNADLTVSMKDLKQIPVSLKVPGLGFAAAYAKMK